MGGREARAEDLISFRPAAARELIEVVAYYERERERFQRPREAGGVSDPKGN